MNRVVIIGRWTKDLDLKFTQGKGTAVANGILAVDRRFKKEGEEQTADFIPVVIWGKQAESTTKWSGKGKLCAVAGRIQIRSYDAKDGIKRYVTEIVAEEVQFLEFKDKKVESEEMIEEVTPVEDGEIPF